MVVIGLAPHASDGGGYEGDEMWELSAREASSARGYARRSAKDSGRW